MIAGLSASGALQAMYPQYNKKKISKVKKVSAHEASTEELQDSSSLTEASALEDEIASNYQTTLAEETQGLETISYDSANPYQASKKSLDESLLLGLHVDERA
ncbi:MAG: hypothetical protein II073_09565 [Lachnospiraceae bacterium]|nr:hypothetical protein [Lachnospiraceae bacterium]